MKLESFEEEVCEHILACENCFRIWTFVAIQLVMCAITGLNIDQEGMEKLNQRILSCMGK